MSQAHFDVETIFDRATPSRGTMTIDRTTGLITMRAHNDRVTYEIRIDQAVTLLVQHVARQKAMEGRKPRKLKVNRGLLRP